MRELDISSSLFVACANDIYRKPRPGMWSLLASQRGMQIDSQKSLIVGDAAGRKNDHSDSDWHWALNLGVEFFTPEVYFKGEISEQPAHKFDPSWFLNPARSSEGESSQNIHCFMD
jgi:bifunctional polynucleotide phosphatase/kinase